FHSLPWRHRACPGHAHTLPLCLHDALPICHAQHLAACVADEVERHPLNEKLGAGPDVSLVERMQHRVAGAVRDAAYALPEKRQRSEEHTSELQSRVDLVCLLTA